MKVEQIYTGCLAQGAYYIESEGEAAVVDPLREPAPYLEKAARAGAQIKYIFESHFHADFVSGHLDLAEKSGAVIIFGPGAKTAYNIHEAKDGELFQLGGVQIKVLHTPGHTMESACFLLMDENDKAYALFSGDTLFIGDVGRPDLAVKTDLSREDLASYLFDSLRDKLMTLPDDVIVYPAHGAGSACGKNLSTERWDTLGHQKEVNYALRSDMSREEFIEKVTDGILPPPQYFAKNAMMNQTGYDSLDTVLERGNVALDTDTFESLANHEGALVLDTRSPIDFAREHIPKAIFIGIDGGFAPWAGALISDLKQAIVFIADDGREEEVVRRLSRVGYDNTLGFLKGGMDAWRKAGKQVDCVQSIPAAELESKQKEVPLNILDVRKPGEFASEHVKGAETFPLDFINEQMHQLRAGKQYHVHCAGGYRSMIACSIMKSRGFHNVIDVAGGYAVIKETTLPQSDYSCSSP